jgi:rSAM/selenodomain-associated transferase 1
MNRVVVFLKYPEPGRVKTRLAAEIGSEAAARLSKHFAEVTVTSADALNLPVDISFDPPEREAEVRAWLGPLRQYNPQAGTDLGQRMCRAFEQAFTRGAGRVALTGTDAPDRPAQFLVEALERLEKHDVVLGPATDGGYHLIAMCQDTFTPEVFEGIAWSTPAVLVQTLDVLRRAGRSVWVLPPWRDIDDKAGLDAYLEGHPETAGFLEDDQDDAEPKGEKP